MIKTPFYKLNKPEGHDLVSTPGQGPTALNENADIIEAALMNDVWRKSVMRRVNTSYPLNPDYYIYVATTGSDTTGDGTQANPFASLSKAIDLVSIYTPDSYKRIELAAGDYYEDGLHILAGGHIVISGAGSATTRLHITGIGGGSNGIIAFALQNFLLQDMDIICDYNLASNFIYLDGTNTTILNCSISSSVAQTNTNFRAIHCAGKVFLAVYATGNESITGFHRGISCQRSSVAYCSISGDAPTMAYEAYGGFIFVDTAIPPIFGAITESRGGQVRFSHLQGFNNTVTIHVSPTGDDRNWGQSATYPVQTLARARSIAQRCEGTGSIIISCPNGMDDVNATILFHGISRRVFFQGNASNPLSARIRLTNASGNSIQFQGCAEVFFSGVELYRVGQGNGSVVIIMNTPFDFQNTIIDSDVVQASDLSIGVRAIASNGRIFSNVSISKTYSAIYADTASEIHANAVQGAGNQVALVSSGAILINTGAKPGAIVAPIQKYNGGVIFDNGVAV